MYHQHFAGNCFENPSNRCLVEGIGPSQFDCSGLVIASICQSLGIPTKSWSHRLRHVRDIWQEANEPSGSSVFVKIEPQIGSLLIFRKFYTIEGERQEVAGHIGIVTHVEGDKLKYIHANPAKGVVEESEATFHQRILGAVMLRNEAAIELADFEANVDSIC